MKMSGLDVKNRFTGAMVALVFAVCFGGVGVFASWVVGGTLWGAWEANSWNRVPAEILAHEGGAVEYRYKVDGQPYTGRRIGIAVLEMEEPPGVQHAIASAAATNKPLEVLVDPADPTRSVVDATIPWTMVIGMLPFALGFGAVGIGALAMMVGMLLPEREEEDSDTAIASEAGSGFFALAIFTFIWNALAFPIAGVVVMESVGSGEWLALLVLIFPLVGLLLIWGVVNMGLNWLRRGGAKLHPQQLPPRLGGAFSGYVAFARGANPGDAFKVVLKCVGAGSDSGPPVDFWQGQQQARVADVGGRCRLTFRFDAPSRIEGIARDAQTNWHLDLVPAGKDDPAFSFHFKMLPPFGVEHLPEEALRPSAVLDDDELVPAGVPKGLEAVTALAGEGRIAQHLRDMPAAKREQMLSQIEQLTPGQKEAVEKVARYAGYLPLVKKLFLWAIALFVLVQVVGVVSMILFAS